MCNKSVTSFTLREVVGMNFADVNPRSLGYITLCAHCTYKLRYDEYTRSFYRSIQLNQRVYDCPLKNCHLCDVKVIPGSDGESNIQLQINRSATERIGK